MIYTLRAMEVLSLRDTHPHVPKKGLHVFGKGVVIEPRHHDVLHKCPHFREVNLVLTDFGHISVKDQCCYDTK